MNYLCGQGMYLPGTAAASSWSWYPMSRIRRQMLSRNGYRKVLAIVWQLQWNRTGSLLTSIHWSRRFQKTVVHNGRLWLCRGAGWTAVQKNIVSAWVGGTGTFSHPVYWPGEETSAIQVGIMLENAAAAGSSTAFTISRKIKNTDNLITDVCIFEEIMVF